MCYVKNLDRVLILLRYVNGLDHSSIALECFAYILKRWVSKSHVDGLHSIKEKEALNNLSSFLWWARDSTFSKAEISIHVWEGLVSFISPPPRQQTDAVIVAMVNK